MKEKYNLDKLKISLESSNDDLFKHFTVIRKNDKGVKEPVNRKIKFNNFDLYLLDIDNLDEPKQISLSLCFSDSKEIGKLTINQNNRYNNRCFLEFKNRFLYSERLNKIPPILDELGFTLSTVTQMEIARDLNYNIYAKINRLFKDPSIIKILNGDRIRQGDLTNREVYYKTTTDRIIRNQPCYYFKPSTKYTMELKCYNKSKEIETTSKKEYIKQYDGFTDKETIYRAEILIYWDVLRPYLSANAIDWNNNFLLQLENKDFLKQLYDEFSCRLVRFKTPQDINIKISDL